MMYKENINLNEDVCRWIWKGVDWEGYMNDLRESASRDAASVIDEMNAERLLEDVMSWIRSANDRRMRRYQYKDVRKLAWWTDKLEGMKKSVRKLRRTYQRARRHDRRRENERLDAYKSAVWKYKREICRVKEEN